MKMRNRMVHWTSAALLAAGFFAGQRAEAAAILSDNFEITAHPTGDRTIAVPPALPVYTRYAPTSGSATIGDDSAAGGLGSNALIVADTDALTGTAFPLLVSLPSAITLTSVGDTATLSFRFRYVNNGAPAGGNNFRFGLFSSNGTPVTADNQTTSNNDIGYYAAIGQGGTAPTTSQIFYEETGTLVDILGGTDRTSVLASANTGTGINDNTPHTVALRLTRTAAGVELGLSIDGSSFLTGNDNATPRTSFDEIAFGGAFATTGQAYNLDDVVLDYSPVPEPTGIALAAISGVALLGRRRQRTTALARSLPVM